MLTGKIAISNITGNKINREDCITNDWTDRIDTQIDWVEIPEIL